MSIRVMTDNSGKSRGFGFVSFEHHEDAQKVSAMSLGLSLSGTLPQGHKGPIRPITTPI